MSKPIAELSRATVRDHIAPSAIKIEYNYIQIGANFVRTLFTYSYPRYLYVDWLSSIINVDISLNASVFIYPVDTPTTLKKLRNKSAQISSSISEDLMKGKVRDPLLETAAEDVESLRDSLQKGESKLFKVGLYFTIIANSLESLEKNTQRIESILGGTLIMTKNAIFQQEQGFNSTLPIGRDQLIIEKNLDTGALSTLFPFSSSEMSQNDGILYGINRHTNGLVLFDRFALENANSVILAKSGSGKSYAVKLELLRHATLGTEIIVIDPENEYEKLCNALSGSYLNLSVNSNHRINPFDLPRFEVGDQEASDALRANIIMLRGLIKIMLGQITALEDNLLDKALVQVYASKGITKDPTTHSLTPPLMSDLVKVLNSIKGAENMAASLIKYSEGSFSGIFNERTNVDLNNRFIVFSIRDLEDELRPLAMYMILNYIWNKVKSSRKKRILAVDEAWIMMKHQDSAQFLFSIAKRARKYYLGVSTIIQDVEDFLASPYGRAIINNSSMTMLLKQHPAAIDFLTETYNLTTAEKYFLLNCEVGEGLFFAGLNHVALQVLPSYQEDLLVTTNPEQLNTLEGK